MAATRTQKRIHRRALWWLAGLLFVNFGLMSYDARDADSKERIVRVWGRTLAYPAQRAIAFIGNQAVDAVHGFGERRRASMENRLLRQQVEQMETKLRVNRELASEADRLSILLNLRLAQAYPTVAARVVARGPSGWFDTVTIDKGSLAGIENNMPVISDGGIVGRIIATGPLSAQVMLITNEKSGVGGVVGELSKSDVFGSIKGMGDNGLLDMRYVSSLEKVTVGDTIQTTGQDAIYPPGMPVGSVLKVQAGSASQSQVIHVKPSAGIDRLREVLVLKYNAPSRNEDAHPPIVNQKAAEKAAGP